MTSLELYRVLVPDHAVVLDGVIEAYLQLAAQRHTADRWGDAYVTAMIWYAAHLVETTPGSGAPGAPTSGQVQGPLISQKDGDLSRTYAEPASASAGATGDDAWLLLTTYGQRYLEIRSTRAAAAPTFVRARYPSGCGLRALRGYPWRG